ncbi:MAG: TRAP transporter large permease subunit [Chloroflexi bacterium]|nr:TRAP transporter large permease subunit [Chloroflexota bacterium]
MEWWISLIIIGGLLLAFLFSGIPVAFAFLALNMIGYWVFVGGAKSIQLLVPSAFGNIGIFTLVPLTMFILMGEVMFQAGLVKIVIDNLGKLMGRLRGSLSILGIASGTVFAMMSGSSISGVAMFGSTLAPEMKKRGYQSAMIYGPILAAGSLAMMIPPSNMAIIIATLSQQSVGAILIAIVIPGFILAGIYFTYIVVRCWLQPNLAPAFGLARISRGEKIRSVVVVMPMSLVIFMTLGLIFLGVSTPSEAAALGATGSFIVAALYGRLTWGTVRKTLWETVKVSAMIFTIVMSASAFSELLAYSGVIRELGRVATSAPVPPIVIVGIMMVVMLLMGCFIEALPMVMILVPIFFPVIRTLGLNPIWFAVLMMLNTEIGGLTPPFGIYIFTLKGVAPEVPMTELFRAAIPIFFLLLVEIILLLLIPPLTTWLPGLMLK